MRIFYFWEVDPYPLYVRQGGPLMFHFFIQGADSVPQGVRFIFSVEVLIPSWRCPLSSTALFLPQRPLTLGVLIPPSRRLALEVLNPSSMCHWLCSLSPQLLRFPPDSLPLWGAFIFKVLISTSMPSLTLEVWFPCRVPFPSRWWFPPRGGFFVWIILIHSCRCHVVVSLSSYLPLARWNLWISVCKPPQVKLDPKGTFESFLGPVS